MRNMSRGLALLALVLAAAPAVAAQESSKRSYFPGTAVVQVADGEHTIPIDCYVRSRPDLGFTTEPNQVTRLRTGRISSIDLSVGPADTDGTHISLEGYVAKIPNPTSDEGSLSLSVDLTREDASADRVAAVAFARGEGAVGGRAPDALRVVIEAQCNERVPDAPAYRDLGKPRGGGN